MSYANSTSDLKSELNRYEAHLETPLVPGELADWLQAAEQSLSVLLPVLRAHIEGRDREEIEGIAEQDPGLFTRVEQLEIEDLAILAAAERHFKMVSPMAKHSDSLEPDEARAAGAVEKISDEGLYLVIRIRKQESAIRTWLMEAFGRDRGVID